MEQKEKRLQGSINYLSEIFHQHKTLCLRIDGNGETEFRKPTQHGWNKALMMIIMMTQDSPLMRSTMWKKIDQWGTTRNACSVET